MIVLPLSHNDEKLYDILEALVHHWLRCLPALHGLPKIGSWIISKGTGGNWEWALSVPTLLLKFDLTLLVIL